MYIGNRVRYPLFRQVLIDFFFQDGVSQNIRTKNFVKMCVLEAELVHVDVGTDRQTDRQK